MSESRLWLWLTMVRKPQREMSVPEAAPGSWSAVEEISLQKRRQQDFSGGKSPVCRVLSGERVLAMHDVAQG